MQRIELIEAIEVMLKDGSVYRVRPGPYGKGVAVEALDSGRRPAEGAKSSGRPPRKGTLLLRSKLEQDAQNKRVRGAMHYLEWFLRQDPSTSAASARNIVYRERRRVLDRFPKAAGKKARKSRSSKSR